MLAADGLDTGDIAAVLEFARNSESFTPGMYGSRLLQDFTDDHDLLNNAIASIGANGSTPLYDAVLDAVTLVDADELHNPAVVVLTDGLENASTVGTLEVVVSTAIAAKVPIFPIGLGTNIDFSRLQEMARGVKEFMKKADLVTGAELNALKKEIRELKKAKAIRLTKCFPRWSHLRELHFSLNTHTLQILPCPIALK